MMSNSRGWLGILLTLTVTLAGCAVGSSRPDASPTEGAPGEAQDWQDVDAALRASYSGSLAYSAPTEMLLDEVKTVRLLLSPTLDTAELEEALADLNPTGGETISAVVSVTPRMRAELVGSPPGAFQIQPLHADPEQLLGSVEPTAWDWNVTAREEGRQTLTLIVYRLVAVDGREYWRQVTYVNAIQVNVTLLQRLAYFDWYWLVGLVASGLIFPFLLHWARRRSRRPR